MKHVVFQTEDNETHVFSSRNGHPTVIVDRFTLSMRSEAKKTQHMAEKKKRKYL